MADVTNVDLELFPRAAGDKTVSATTGDGGGLVVWMNSVFHGFTNKKYWVLSSIAPTFEAIMLA